MGSEMEEAAEKRALEGQAVGRGAGRPRRLLRFLRRRLTPRLGAALILWRVEARLATPLALALVVAWGRWSGALAMGGIMALYAALFLFLLDGERALEELRGWVQGRRLARRYLFPLVERRDRLGWGRWALALSTAVMVLGPFWRAVTFHLFRVPRLPAYALAVGGSIPHSLLWTGVVLGGVWEGLLWPLLKGLVP